MEYVSEILSFIIGVISGGVTGSLLTLRFTRKNRASGGGSIVDQTNASAGGDVVGRDKTVGPVRRS